MIGFIIVILTFDISNHIKETTTTAEPNSVIAVSAHNVNDETKNKEQ
jgi:hypothetical protein